MPSDVIDQLNPPDPVVSDKNVTPPRLGFLGGLRWMWRQLTSMRTALILLFLLALAAIPGSVFPQRGTSPLRVAEYLQDHTTIGPWLDRLNLFDVYAAPWFAAIYLLLMVSLAGCIVPRCFQYARNVRSVPPAAPRNLARMPEHRSWTVDGSASVALDRAERVIRSQRFRVRPRDEGAHAVSAERGYLHEIGNLLFHVSLLVLLVGVAWGAWFGYRGNVVVVEGEGFANTLTQYDDFSPGRGFSPSLLAPFSFTLDDFEATFLQEGPRRGQPDSFTAEMTYRTSADAEPTTTTVEVNHPLGVDGAKVFLIGSGYAPMFTVRDGDGDVVYSGAVPALPQDASFTSTTVVKVPDVQPEQLGFNVTVAPTAPERVSPATGPKSLFPEADNPRVYLGAWAGDLGLDTGIPQNVYQLDTSDMKQLGRQDLAVGETWQLPGDRGSITFDGLAEFANLQVASDPGRWVALWAVGAGLIGITLSLLVHRRRVWVRVSRNEEGRTLVEVAGLSQTEWSGLANEVDAVAAQIQSDQEDDKEHM
ncbi:MAG TPA: cytochrome c biogenesis protein ResB [Actinomycetes bacterium]|nr:cytochrome c biogenesis protein ResB [Actinomycetes bacterium]